MKYTNHAKRSVNRDVSNARVQRRFTLYQFFVSFVCFVV